MSSQSIHLWVTSTCCSTATLSHTFKDEWRCASPSNYDGEKKKFLSPLPHFVLVVVDGDVLQYALVELHSCAHGSVDATAVTAAAGWDSTGGEAPVTLSDTFRLLFLSLPQSKKQKKRRKRPYDESAAGRQGVRQALLLHRLWRRRETRCRRSGILCGYICHLDDLSPQSPRSILLLA